MALAPGGDWKKTLIPLAVPPVTVWVLQQPQKANCGPASVCMVVYQGLNDRINVATMGKRIREFGAPQEKPVKVSGEKKVLSEKEAVNKALGDVIMEAINYKEGSKMDALLSVMRKYHPQLNPYASWEEKHTDAGSTLSASLADANICNANRPALCHIDWGGEEGHFAVCLGSYGQRFHFADPFYGAVASWRPWVDSDSFDYYTEGNSFKEMSCTGKIAWAIFTER